MQRDNFKGIKLTDAEIKDIEKTFNFDDKLIDGCKNETFYNEKGKKINVKNNNIKK